MKQVIVNVDGLTIEEKQRVNEAMAKIMGVRKIPLINNSAGWFFAPASSGSKWVTWGLPSSPETPTHTPQQVLEMAGMALASSGAALVSTKRKVRKDFDPMKSISVDVYSCTEEEKKEVQQAFYDVGIKWETGVVKFRHLDAVLYTNSTFNGTWYDHLMYGTLPRKDSISHQQFLSMVYEPEQQGHIHSDLMEQYAKDAKTTDKPWELWQIKDVSGEWRDLTCNPSFATHLGYRRKPKTHTVNGVEVPDLRIKPKVGEEYWFPDTSTEKLVYGTVYGYEPTIDTHRVSNSLCYEPTEEGMEAAILHAKAMLGIA